jgi:membrane-associated phospholipid phosphatase
MAFLLRATRRPFATVAELARDWLLPSRTMQRRWWPPAHGFAYIALIGVLGGLGGQHIMLGCLGLLDAYNEKTRLFLRTFFAFIITGAIYDSLRYTLDAGTAGRIHVAGPYLFDRAFFGVAGHTLNEFFAIHHWAIADLVSGFSYLIYVAEYLALGMILFFTGHVHHARTFSRAFFAVNILGFITYFAYPAAPPWYVAIHGFGPADMNVPPSPGAAQRFDALLGTHIFSNMYGHSVEVFGAIPSLHVAYPLMAAVLAFRIRELRWARWPALIYAPIMCFSAIYLQHHYMIDVLVGLLYASLVITAILLWERRSAKHAPVM